MFAVADRGEHFGELIESLAHRLGMMEQPPKAFPQAPDDDEGDVGVNAQEQVTGFASSPKLRRRSDSMAQANIARSFRRQFLASVGASRRRIASTRPATSLSVTWSIGLCALGLMSGSMTCRRKNLMSSSTLRLRGLDGR